MAGQEETFGQRLRRLREQAGLTQEQLAEKAGLHRMGVAKLEQGDRTDPSWSTVQALATALGVTCEAFEGTIIPAGDEPAKGPGPGRPRKKPAEGEAPPTEVEQKPQKRKGK